MTKGETIEEISKILRRYRGDEYAVWYITNLFSTYVDTPWGAQTSRKASFRKILNDLREEYDA
jgi:hypothetical protein